MQGHISHYLPSALQCSNAGIVLGSGTKDSSSIEAAVPWQNPKTTKNINLAHTEGEVMGLICTTEIAPCVTGRTPKLCTTLGM